VGYRGGNEPAGDYTFFNEKGNENHESGPGFFVCKRIMLAVKRAEFAVAIRSHVILRGRWCDIIVLNAHAPAENKTDNTKDSFYEELKCVFNISPTYNMKIVLGDFSAKVARKVIFRQTVGSEMLRKIMIME
jgi:hypothetical protein